ncbi:MAG TPA: hypothetical protein VNA69_16825 [Thermoanaerobaculia bacterium]|nr:hypothetical protein [Thermoanaerobaculia bacterium]
MFRRKELEVPEDETPVKDEQDEIKDPDLGWDEDENEERRRDPLRQRLPE